MEISHPVHESDTSGFDGVATPNTLSNSTPEPILFVPSAKLIGITRSKLCELQAQDNSLKCLQKLAKDNKERCLYKDGVLYNY